MPTDVGNAEFQHLNCLSNSTIAQKTQPGGG
jgi:hypothetical protein